MTRSHIMNLRTGLTTCTTCGHQYAWDIQVCPNPNCGKRVVAVQHADGTRDVAPVDPVTQRWSSDAEKAAQKAEGEVLSAALADEKCDDFLTHIADQFEDMLDWYRILGDCAL